MNRNRFLIILLTLCCFSGFLNAQTPPGDCPCDPDDPGYEICAAMNPDCDPVASIPINTDVSWLLFAGITVGAYVTYRTKTAEPISSTSKKVIHHKNTVV